MANSSSTFQLPNPRTPSRSRSSAASSWRCEGDPVNGCGLGGSVEPAAYPTLTFRRSWVPSEGRALVAYRRLRDCLSGSSGRLSDGLTAIAADCLLTATPVAELRAQALDLGPGHLPVFREDPPLPPSAEVHRPERGWVVSSSCRERRSRTCCRFCSPRLPELGYEPGDVIYLEQPSRHHPALLLRANGLLTCASLRSSGRPADG
jgi:hypothetical protein